jgi:hypothetical protein
MGSLLCHNSTGQNFREYVLSNPQTLHMALFHLKILENSFHRVAVKKTAYFVGRKNS